MTRILAALIIFTSTCVSAEEYYPELDCPSRTPIVVAGAVIGAAIVYELVAPGLPQQNGINFITSVAVGAVSGGFAGAVYAQKSCQTRVSLTSESMNICFDF